MQRLRHFRDSLKLSQKVFAEKIGISRSSLALMETGRNKVSADVYRKIIDVFGVNLLDENNIENIVSNDNLNRNQNDNLNEDSPSVFIANSYKELTEIKNNLETVIAILFNYSEYAFDEADIAGFMSLERVLKTATNVMYDKQELDNKTKNLIKNTLLWSKPFLDAFFSKIKHTVPNANMTLKEIIENYDAKANLDKNLMRLNEILEAKKK